MPATARGQGVGGAIGARPIGHRPSPPGDPTIPRPVTFALQFRGHATTLAPGVVLVRASAPGASLVTEIDVAGLHGTVEARGGEEARLECRLTFLTGSRFEQVGTISLGNGNALRFRSAGEGTIIGSADPRLRHGAVALDVDGGAGFCLGLAGRIVSNFLLSDAGDLTDHQLGVLFFAAPGVSPAAAGLYPAPATEEE